MSREMRCIELVEVVTEWMEGALDDEDRVLLEAHLLTCGRCVAYVARAPRRCRCCCAASPPTDRRPRPAPPCWMPSAVPVDPAWRRWGPYLAERAWGTVREDYSPNGDAWEDLPHDHARSRAYRWNEDGLGGLSDDGQRLCFAFAFWNGVDPILKERIFGLTGNEGNHGEDAKEHWWFLDSTPTHSWMRWRYWYPQREFPYADLTAENRAPEPPGARVRAARHRRSSTRTATGTSPPTTRRRPRTTSASGCRCATPDPRRPPSTCSRRSGSATRGPGAATTASPRSSAKDGTIVTEHAELGRMVLTRRRPADGAGLRERVQRRAPLGDRGVDGLPEGRDR